ncbi:hypothetical protein CYLTODRAFT_345243 [Cylindrobasidium torrendii FP15055 ss-10]|uniref:histone acetyltransferase n=1 Tax=Cylindrobasidium torrendii FP15055 ss-10 TaxID=1314674 RepID=A0A0D7BNM7_9AGAR|nr:hypothetical protein CYLTODRAFT_345243 [Cylindrobasidium torrendii FP15055 ss-10]
MCFASGLTFPELVRYYSPYPIPAREGKDLEPDDPGRVIVKTEDGLNRIEEPFILWICHQCFKYMSLEAFQDHIKICPHTKPPGRKVYQNGGVSMYEVDGFQNKVYCQCLCLLCKCFIDIKTLYFDCESFLFYVMTLVDEETGEEQVIGYFSKERFSFNSHNLACIIVLPPWQKRGFGMLMIEFSYYLSRKQGMIGGPEGPLSDLGLIGYYSYWVSSIIRFLRQQISVPLPKDNLETSHPFSYLKKPRHPVVPYPANPDDASSSSANEDEEDESDHELPAPVIKRRYYHSMMPNGEVRVGVTARFTMKDIVQATGIRPREVAFVLHQLGLSRMEAQMQADADDVVIILSREAIESVAAACRMKEPRFSEKHLIP